MQLSAKTQNACLAMMELARRYANPQPVCLKTIAEEQGISSQFLVQILLQLKRGGLVRSTRGASGGYRLARSPRDVNLLDIVRAMDGVVDQTVSDNTTSSLGVLHEAWHASADVFYERLASVSLESLADRVPNRSGDMYYI